MSDGITQRGWMESTPATVMERYLSNKLPLGHVDIDKAIKAVEEKLIAADKLDPKNATKFDQGKADWSQVPFSGLEGMVAVLEFGAKKYAKANWTTGGGFSHTRVMNSCMRHMFAYMEGQDNDPESGLSHIHHAQCNLLFLAFYKKYPEKFSKDDRTIFISEQ